MTWLDQYKYVGLHGEPVSWDDAVQLMTSPDRVLAQEEAHCPDGVAYRVSTVLLPHMFHLPTDSPGYMKPWETEVAGPDGRCIHFRYDSRQEALDGHATSVKVVRTGCIAPILDAMQEVEEEAEKLGVGRL